MHSKYLFKLKVFDNAFSEKDFWSIQKSLFENSTRNANCTFAKILLKHFYFHAKMHFFHLKYISQLVWMLLYILIFFIPSQNWWNALFEKILEISLKIFVVLASLEIFFWQFRIKNDVSLFRHIMEHGDIYFNDLIESSEVSANFIVRLADRDCG